MCNNTKKDHKYADLGCPANVWAVPSVHGHYDQLARTHDTIYENFQPGDVLLYLGNYTGYGPDSVSVIDELLTFRRMILSIPGVFPDDIVYLRGQQEEMFSKLLQLQFAPEAHKVLKWMMSNGLDATMASYGIDMDRGLRASLEGVTGLGYWTKTVAQTVRQHPGHENFRNSLKRAAFTNMSLDHPLLFVHAGLEPSKALSFQGDNFWWCGTDFHAITRPYRPFERVIRGYDPDHEGVLINGVTATIDNGCGFGGDLVFALIQTQTGHMDVFSA